MTKGNRQKCVSCGKRISFYNSKFDKNYNWYCMHCWVKHSKKLKKNKNRGKNKDIYKEYYSESI